MSHYLMDEFSLFIKKEKEKSNVFLRKLQIFDDRFNEYEYDFLKPIFLNTDFIKKVYILIDDIIEVVSSGKNFDDNLRFIVMGDFLFSMTSFNLKDPANLIFKISRSDYFKEINLRACINCYFGYD